MSDDKAIALQSSKVLNRMIEKNDQLYNAWLGARVAAGAESSVRSGQTGKPSLKSAGDRVISTKK